MRKASILLAALLVISCANPAGNSSSSDYGGPVIRPSDRARAEEIVGKMTVEEKITLLGGDRDNPFYSIGNERLGIPVLRTADGPQGLRNKTKSTYYPAGIAMAATWNPELGHSVGEGLGLDAKARGVAILLGPGVNIYRNALCGRNFEYYGEDPFLAGEMASAYIKGVQEQGVIATIKHFVCCNQEYSRFSVSANVDERTLNEIYFPAYRKAVKQAKVGAVMTSYNPLNGPHTPESAWLIKGNLRKWGFEGIVMSDWGSCYDPLLLMHSGIDFEMPDAFALKVEKVKPLIDNGVVPMKELDEKCIHLLQTFSAFGLLDKDIKDDSLPEDIEENNQRAYAAAQEAPVLLKNEGNLLPVKPEGNPKVVLIGPNADIVPLGGGSGAVTPPDGRAMTLKEALGQVYEVTYLEKPEPQALREADVVIISAGFHRTYEHEGSDRTYTLPEGQDALFAEVLQYNPNVVAVMNSGGEFDMTAWIDKVPVVMMAWYGGQCGGKALADIISGKISPSGRLPFTFWGTLEKNPATPYYYPIESPYPGNEKWRDPVRNADYVEGVFLGYRGVEHFGVKPLYPFGYGLTYSSFEYSDLAVKPVRGGVDVSFTLTNTGETAAAEVAQVYVAPVNPSVPRPAHELKGFVKKLLQPGESARLTVHLDRDAFAHYDLYAHDWAVDSGSYEIQVAASSEDIRLQASCKR